MKKLLIHLRLIVYVLNGIIALSIFMGVKTIFPSPQLQIIRITQLCALAAVINLYLSLLASPLSIAFPTLPLKRVMLKSRKALGISAFFYGLTHASFAFFGQLGGFAGLGFLSANYLIAIAYSFSALLILTALTITSLHRIKRHMGKYWKILHRLVYVAGMFIIVHAVMLGTHFTDLSTAIPQVFLIALAVLFMLEALRLDLYVSQNIVRMPRVGLMFLTVSVLIGILLSHLFNRAGRAPSFGIHAIHIQLAKEALTTSHGPSISQIPGMSGDRTKRYTVSMNIPDAVQAHTDVPIRFDIYDAGSGNAVKYYRKLYGKGMHMVVVDSQLIHYDHIHPDQTSNGFSITTQFPHDGVYHIYLNYQPFEAIEQQTAFTVAVGDINQTEAAAAVPLDTRHAKIVDGYEVMLQLPDKPLRASEMTLGQQQITVIIHDAKTKKPITTLKPYLEAFGHLVMINQKTYEYLHVHPTFAAPTAGANAGPRVDFIPIGIYGPIKSGTYRVFLQLNPDNHLITADFTIRIQ